MQSFPSPSEEFLPMVASAKTAVLASSHTIALWYAIPVRSFQATVVSL